MVHKNRAESSTRWDVQVAALWPTWEQIEQLIIVKRFRNNYVFLDAKKKSKKNISIFIKNI
uniref:Uncharacterized protein n=1 Tax=viral metagenome TaxID=1070528 RepID=A0A6C0F8G0_9ZZZZ